MTLVDTKPEASTHNTADPLERRGTELILFRLRCTHTANGLSHYYMYGDVAPEQTLL